MHPPLFYNGDLHTVEHIRLYHHTVPPIGRYRHRSRAIANPALALEYKQGNPISSDEMAKKSGATAHRGLGAHQELLQGGEVQLAARK